jgi:hypothetical protein
MSDAMTDYLSINREQKQARSRTLIMLPKTILPKQGSYEALESGKEGNVFF